MLQPNPASLPMQNSYDCFIPQITYEYLAARSNLYSSSSTRSAIIIRAIQIALGSYNSIKLPELFADRSLDQATQLQRNSCPFLIFHNLLITIFSTRFYQ